MKKENKLLLILLCAMLLLTGCKKEKNDAVKFKEEYTSVSEDNKFLYKSEEELLEYIKNKQTFILFVCNNENEWCNSIVKIIDESAKSNKVNVYYINSINSFNVLKDLNVLNDSNNIIGVVKGETKYLLNKDSSENEIKDLIDKMTVEINSCDINVGC